MRDTEELQGGGCPSIYKSGQRLVRPVMVFQESGWWRLFSPEVASHRCRFRCNQRSKTTRRHLPNLQRHRLRCQRAPRPWSRRSAPGTFPPGARAALLYWCCIAAVMLLSWHIYRGSCLSGIRSVIHVKKRIRSVMIVSSA
jgi:hypothetical protein